jgi:hypothetical protein
MELYNLILQYLERNGNPNSHTFKCGTKVIGIPLKTFLMEWYDQAVQEYLKEGTTKNVNALKQLIN